MAKYNNTTNLVEENCKIFLSAHVDSLAKRP